MSISENPLVSVVIPIYNMQEFLTETIESVLQSTYPRYELILVDDGSTDQSIEIGKRFSQQDSRIKFFAQSNGGASKARNFAIQQASGKYILPVDADNLISSDYIEQAVETLENNQQVKIVTCEAIFFGEKQGKWELPPFSLKLLARKNLMDNCAMYRKSDWQKAGGYCEEILGREDWDFWISMLKTGGDVVRLPIVGLHYRVRSNSKRKRTRNLKSLLISQLNSRHKAFFYEQLGGPLHVSRTWSEVFNILTHLIKPEKIVVEKGFDDLVYNIPEIFNQHAEKQVLNFVIENTDLEASKYISNFSFSKSKAHKIFDSQNEKERVGYYEKRTILGYCESYFVKRKVKSAPKASLIIAVYKNTVFLKAVLDSLKNQTEKDFEVIIAEDGESPEMKDFLNDYSFEQTWQHITQKDEGWRKNHAMNRAINASSSNWLIFIDGDCVLHSRFIEMHLRFADEHTVLAGKRVKLDKKLSDLLLSNKLTVSQIQKSLLRRLLVGKGEIKFMEEGIFISPDGILGFIPRMRKLNYLKGCNMSFSKQAISAINGFDEDYQLPAIGEDIDLSWRFKKAGFKHKSVRNMAIQYHLHHTENWTSQKENAAIMAQKKENNEYICKNGLLKPITKA